MLAAEGIAALGAGPTAGYVARGTATMALGSGSAAGAIIVKAWGASHCRITFAVGAAGTGGAYTAVANGTRWRVSASGDLGSLPPPLGPDVGCALLPQGLLLAELSSGAAAAAAGALANQLVLFRPQPGQAQPPRPMALDLDPASGLPQRVSWSLHFAGRAAQAVSVAYSDFQSADGVSYPATVVESVGGAPVWTVHFDAFTARGDFSDADFAVPAPRRPAALRRAGGRQ
ncbi:MAG TPA: hypothetical protein VNF74_11825 [Terriglobales bacterium]|nr:hypothetical protein [Terriglobales bacterium]